MPSEPKEMAPSSGEPPPNTDVWTGAVFTPVCVSEKEKGEEPVEVTVTKVNVDGFDLSMTGTPNDAKTKG